jgi:two-component system, NtrC family, sensor histidine kinase PilS
LSRRIYDFVRPEGLRNGPEFRKKVEWLMLLRLLITTLLLGITIFFQLRESGEFFEYRTVPLYVLIGTTFFLSIIYAIALPLTPDLWTFSFIQVILDVLYATVLIHFTGGASSIFTILYIFPIITSGFLHFRRGALIIASVAALLFGLLIDLEFYQILPSADWQWVNPLSRNTAGYLLWVLIIHFTFFFVVAFLSSSFAEQLQKTKNSLNLTESHFKNLADLHRSIVKCIPSGIITTDEDDKIIFINDAGQVLLNVQFSNVSGQPLSNLFPALVDGLTNGKTTKDRLLTNKEINGEIKSFDITIADLRTKESISKGRLIVFQDVTKIRRMEERVKLSEKQAAFVRIAAGMAHEIRNPLAALRASSELLSQNANKDSAVDKRLLGIVIKESDRLNSLLGDFLITVASSGSKKATLNLTELVEETVALFSQEPRLGSGIKLESLVESGIEIAGDSQRLKQALWNLLNNALEASTNIGSIRVTLDYDVDQNDAVLKIQDFGCGIPSEMRDLIFEPFTSTKEKGTGLGLSVVLSVVEAHNGHLEMETMKNKGTTFVIRIPVSEHSGSTGDVQYG